MQAQLRTGSSLGHLISYHENKVKDKVAECILAENFIKDLADLTIKDKAYHFERLNSLNENISKPNVQFSIDFHPSDELNNGKMIEIAREFMQRMGMDHQPYLVYRHDDAYHPHMHIITPRVQSNGQRTELGKREFHEMHRISREIEAVHRFIPLGGSDQRQDPSMPAHRVHYGKEPTFAAVNQVLQTVAFGYAYTSLAELNAALRLYNVEAYAGLPGSKLAENKGLIYRVLKEGRSRVTPIKASKFTGKPTLKLLEQKYIENAPLQEQRKTRMIANIERTFYRGNQSLEAFRKEMAKEKIAVVFNKENQVFYVDHNQKAVFQGEILGPRYAAEQLLSRCVSEMVYQKEQEKIQEQQQSLGLYL